MKLSYAAAAAMLACTLTLAALPAQAQNARSFVSSKGLDTNSCILQAPCRTFQRAHDMTNANGEIDVLDTAGYGPLTITKGISIINDGVGTASMVAPNNGFGIIINAGANSKVKLRGLTIDGGGNLGATGIYVQAGLVTIENCSSRGNVTGISITSSAGFFSISDSAFADNSSTGIYANNGAGGTIERTRVFGNQVGLIVAPSGSFAITNLNASGNTSDGIQVFSGATLLMRDSTSAKNGGAGLYIGPNSRAFLTKTLLASNQAGVKFGNAAIGYSYGDNAINWNGQDLQNGTLTPLPLQ